MYNIFCKRVKHSLHSSRRLQKTAAVQIVPVKELSKNVPVTFLNVLFANKLRSNGCEHVTFIWELQVFESMALI